MEIAVRYHTRSGNTKKVADAIGQEAGVKAENLRAPMIGSIDLLFLGSAVYGFDLDEDVKQYISSLSPDRVKSVLLFGTSAIVKNGNEKMAALLREHEINVLDQDFHCHGAFAVMHRGHPSEADLKKAAAFARTAIDRLQGSDT